MNVDVVVQNVIDALSLGSLYALFALGIALIFGIMRLINFAHGELIMIGGYAVTICAGTAWPILLLVSISIVVLAALAMERTAFRPVRDVDPSTLLVTSFAVSFLVQNLAIVVFGSLPRATNVSSALTLGVDLGGFRVSRLSLVTIAVTAMLLASLLGFLHRSHLGTQMRAAAENFAMARVLGVRANTVIATAFAMSGLLAGMASILLVAQTGTVSPTIGLGPVLVAFVATVLGGMGSLLGAVLGGYLLGSITIALQASLPLELRSYRDAFAYTIVIAVLLLRPQGLVVARSVRTRV